MLMSVMMNLTTTLLVWVAILLSREVEAQSDNKCQKIRFESCQKQVLNSNREFIARYTRESVESFSVELYSSPILHPTREQSKLLKKRYRNMFSYPDRTVVDKAPVAPTNSPPPYDPFATTIERNETCTNTTEREEYRGWIRITSNVQCNSTDGYGNFAWQRHRTTRYEALPVEPRIRQRRQVNRVRLCTADYVPTDKVLYTVSSNKGEPVQIAQIQGAYQDQGDISCTPASGIPRDISCVLEMVDSPKVVFKLRGKYIDSESVRLPRCTAYIDV